MDDVEFKDFSFKVKAEINDTVLAWLRTWSKEIASQAQRNCKMRTEGRLGGELAGSYKAEVNEGKAEAVIGSPLEAAFWEEYGTGSHADKSKNGGKPGREGWWVYVKDGTHSSTDSKKYATEAEAQEVAKSMQDAGIDAYATNGRDPNYTLEKAFKSVKPKAIADLEKQLKGMNSR